MWISQTYLGDVERDAHYFVYYLYEDYNPEQKAITKRIQKELENLGECYGDKVSLMMPNPRFANRIESEAREFPELWMSIKEHLPGLLLSPVPLIKLRKSHQQCKYLSLQNASGKHLTRLVMEVREHADLAIASSRSSKANPLLKRIVDAIEVKPGIVGISIDLKKLLEH